MTLHGNLITSRRLVSALTLLVVALAAPAAAAPGDTSPDGTWSHVSKSELLIPRGSEPRTWVTPTQFVAARLDVSFLEEILRLAPMEFTDEARTAPTLITLPTPSGTFELFEIYESPIAEPPLYDWFDAEGWPMRTYKAVSLDQPATTARIDSGGPMGFHAMVESPGQSWFIDPYWAFDREYYVSYDRNDYDPSDDPFSCLVNEFPKSELHPGESLRGTGNLRTYRLANAATREYSAFYGGTVSAAMGGIMTTINRVNQVYERDLSIRLVLVANNQSIVFTSEPDGFTDGSPGALINQVTGIINGAIGSNNYDIGHVFSVGGGGLAGLGVVCGPSKAAGVTGIPSPVGDAFDIDYVSHEMGHQFGGGHTFNSTSGSCGGNNRDPSGAYEPGSGVTIQAYAGICSPNNVSSRSIAAFHRVSLNQIFSYVNDFASCSGSIANDNGSAPVVDAGPDYTIPVSTPFELKIASSSDDDGDTLTYSWEQFDLGTATSLAQGDIGNGPIFRSYLPTTSSSRILPRLNNLLANSTPNGETYPTTSRNINFQVTARDNNPGGGLTGVDAMRVTSTTAAGPFLVTSPNGGETVSGSTMVTWNVASTDVGPVNAATVDVFMATDGGFSFPHVVAMGVPNTGSAMLTIPDLPTTTARIMIKASDNIFFDISNGAFTVVDRISSADVISYLLGTTSDATGLDVNGSSSVDVGDVIFLVNQGR